MKESRAYSTDLTERRPFLTLRERTITMPEASPQITHEAPPTPETEHRNQRLVGLWSRLLISNEAINPSNTLSEITQGQFGNFGERNYRIFQNTSGYERQVHWRGKEGDDFQRQKQAWITHTTEIFTNAQPFFQSPEGTRWNSLFQHLGIDTQHITSEKIESLYQRYFGIDNGSSNVKRFVADVINAHSHSQDGQTVINRELLEQNKDAIQWIASIFGEKSSEIITELIDAETAAKEDPQELIAEANTPTPAHEGQEPLLRINNLTQKEEELLTFLWQHGQQEQVTPPVQIPGETPPQPTPGETTPTAARRRRDWDPYHFRNERVDEEGRRRLPNADIVSHVIDPDILAEVLIENEQTPQYRNVPKDRLTREIALEQQALQQTLNNHGLTESYLREHALGAIRDYTQFLQQEFGIRSPLLEDIVFLPVSGKTAEAIRQGKTEGVFAFVKPEMPIIFLNMDEIKQEAQRMGIQTGNGWQTIPPDQLRSLMERLLNEVHPHEYSHLIGDLAFWRRMKRENGQDISEDVLVPAKTGMKVGKILHLPDVSLGETRQVYQERGRWLSEAVTTEFTKRWADRMHEPLDIDAYPAEREVLLSLEGLLAQEQGISREEAFKKFAKAYFSPIEYRHLVKELSGPQDAQGHYRRPRFLEIVYGLMEYENKKATTLRQPLNSYKLTLAFIQNRLSEEQLQDIRTNINSMPFSTASKDYLYDVVTRPQQQAA